MELDNTSIQERKNTKISYLKGGSGQRLPMVIIPESDKKLDKYFAENVEAIRNELHKTGAILFRGWEVDSAEDFFQVISNLSKKSIDYVQRTSPRSEVIQKVYTSTDYPSDQEIKPHNESSYASVYPLYIGFYCLIQPQQGGETPITDNRAMVSKLSDNTRRLFKENGINYTRNMLEWLGLSWQEVYQTDNKGKVEQLLSNDGMEYEWVDDSHLRVKWYRKAFQIHPINGDKVWFNHSYFYHRQNLDPNLLNLVDRKDMPFYVRFGDHSEIGDDIFNELKEAYDDATIIFKWQKGDILLLDNMLFSHARKPFKGERKILVSMAEPQSYTLNAQ